MGFEPWISWQLVLSFKLHLLHAPLIFSNSSNSSDWTKVSWFKKKCYELIRRCNYLPFCTDFTIDLYCASLVWALRMCTDVTIATDFQLSSFSVNVFWCDWSLSTFLEFCVLKSFIVIQCWYATLDKLILWNLHRKYRLRFRNLCTISNGLP